MVEGGWGPTFKSVVYLRFKCQRLSLYTLSVCSRGGCTDGMESWWFFPHCSRSVTNPGSLCNVTTFEIATILCWPEYWGVTLGRLISGSGSDSDAQEQGACRDMWALGDWPMFCLIVCSRSSGVRHETPGHNFLKMESNEWWRWAAATAARDYITSVTPSSAEYEFRRLRFLNSTYWTLKQRDFL